MLPLPIISEFIFALVAVFFCFAIYLKTKESYELTKYEGIKYFRDAFMFIGVSYLIRFFFSILFFSSIAFDFFIPIRLLQPFFILPLGYFSTIALFYLVFSRVWKKFETLEMLAFGYIMAVLVPVVSFISGSHIALFFLQGVLFILAAVLVYSSKGKNKLMYVLVFFLWLINLFEIGRPIGIISQVLSLAVFIILYVKVSKLA